MTEIIRNDWQKLIGVEFEKQYYLELRAFLIDEYKTHTIYPEKQDLFNSFQYTSYEDTKVVILGQDPYHGVGQAHGMAFSVKPGMKPPPSLMNIYKELKSDIGCEIPNHGYLKSWADQGVLMLNTVLTVRDGEAHSHKNRGWETFTDEVIRKISEKKTPVAFLLWGRPAQEKLALISNPIHGIFQSAHPSPLSASRGFFGSQPFSKVNQFLVDRGIEPIEWCIIKN